MLLPPLEVWDAVLGHLFLSGDWIAFAEDERDERVVVVGSHVMGEGGGRGAFGEGGSVGLEMGFSNGFDTHFEWLMDIDLDDCILKCVRWWMELARCEGEHPTIHTSG